MDQHKVAEARQPAQRQVNSEHGCAYQPQPPAPDPPARIGAQHVVPHACPQAIMDAAQEPGFGMGGVFRCGMG